MDFGCQLGRENRANIDQKRYRKNDEKKKGAKMAKTSQQEALTTLAPPPPGPWEGVGGGDKSPPRGVETRRVEKKRAETRYTTLNHPSPEGWWDFNILIVFHDFLARLLGAPRGGGGVP